MPKPPRHPDYIAPTDFSYEAWEGFKRYFDSRKDNQMDRSKQSITDWCVTFFELRAAEDRPEWFPRGKWATLQVLESYLSQYGKHIYLTDKDPYAQTNS